MKHYITIALCTFLSQMCTAQVMMLFSQDSLTGIVSPLDVDSLFYWFAADVGVTDSLGGAIATDEGVGSWLDLSGRGHHVTQSTNGARPVWKATGGPGSKPTIQFDGTNDFLASAAHWWGSDDLTIFVVMKFGNATRDVFEVLISRSFLGVSQWAFNARNNSGTTPQTYAPYVQVYRDVSGANYNVYHFGKKATNYRVLTFTTNGASTQSAYIDGISSSISTSNVGTGNGSILDGDYITSIGIALLGSISEIIVYSRALSATERTAIELYLNRKYDLY